MLASDRFKNGVLSLLQEVSKKKKLEILKNAGVTRISMGVQSFNERGLEIMGRVQKKTAVYKAYELLRDKGFKNINLDLIFAWPSQSKSELKADLEEAMSLDPEHLSLYCLTFEEKTELWRRWKAKELRKQSAQEEAELYIYAWDILKEGGYQQYEVSNFAKEGQTCKHNEATWKMGSWRGLGPSASSQWQGWRFTEPANFKKWEQKLKEPWELPPKGCVDLNRLSEEMLSCDRLIFGLRTQAGVNLKALKDRFKKAPLEALKTLFENLITEGYLIKKNDTLTLTQEGLLRADGIGKLILEAFKSLQVPCPLS